MFSGTAALHTKLRAGCSETRTGTTCRAEAASAHAAGLVRSAAVALPTHPRMPDVTCRRARGEGKDRGTRPRVGERRPSNRPQLQALGVRSTLKPAKLEALRGGPARRGRCRASDERARRWRDAHSERGQELAHLEHRRGSQQGRDSTLAPRAAEPHPGAYELPRRPCGNERVVPLEVHSFRGGSARTWPALSAEASSEPPRLRESFDSPAIG